MRDDATLRIQLTLDGGRTFGPEVFNAAIRISGPYMDTFAPVDIVSDPMFLFTSDRAFTEQTVKIVTETRKEYADYLAKKISEEIMRQIEARDTVNGYKK
jgi:hypothetical protein